MSNRNDIKITISGDAEGLARELAKAKQSVAHFSSEGEKALSGLRAAFYKLGGAAAAVAGLKDVADTFMKFQGIASALKTVTGSASAAQAEMGYIRTEAQRLGLDIVTLAGSYTKLAASAKGTALEGRQTREIFTAVAEAGRVLNLSGEQVDGALRAISQMMSKGNVQAEELRGQLGERLPGAFQMAARAMGVPEAKLNKMLEQGEVLAVDLLPKLAVELRKTFGAGVAEAADNAAASFTRLENSFIDLKNTIANTGIIDLLAKLADVLSKSIQGWQALSEVTTHAGKKYFSGDDLDRYYAADLATRKKMIDHEKRRRAAAAASDQILNGPTTVGTVLPDGALESQIKAPKKEKTGRGLSSADKAAHEAEKQRQEEIKRRLDAQVDANEQLLAVTEELETAQLSKDDKAIRAITKEHELLLNKSHLLTLMGQQTVEEEARIKEVLGTRMQEQLDDLKDKGKDTAKELKDAFAGWASNMGRDLNEVLWGADLTFGKIGESFGRMLTQMVIQKQVVEPIVRGFDSFNWSSIASFFTTTALADGGIMTSAGPLPLRKYATGGVAYTPQVAIFGEGRTPEAFVPLPDGRRIPVAMQSGSAPEVTVNIINQSGQQVSAKASQPRFDGQRMVVDVWLDAYNRNVGGLRTALTGA